MRSSILILIALLVFTVTCKPAEDSFYDYPLSDDGDQVNYYDTDVDKTADDDKKTDTENRNPMPITIVTEQKEFTRTENDTVKLPCKINGTDYVRLWYKNEENQNEKALLFQYDQRVIAPSNMIVLSDGSLQIANLTGVNAGPYTCIAVYSEDNKAKVVINLKVRTQPKIQYLTVEDNNTVLRAGSTLALTCAASGNPAPHISWHLGGERLGTEGPKLFIPSVTHRNAGTYHCLADNKIGQPAHEEIVIKVEHKPVVTVEEILVNSDHGFDAELKCIVHSEPRAQVTWKKDGINIVNDKRFTLENHQHNHNLMIKNLEKSDFGVYTCAAVNYLDTTSKDIKLVRTPTILEFIKPQADLKDSVLAWRVASKAAISHYELQYRKKGESNWKLVKPKVTPAEDGDKYIVRYTLKGLQSGAYETRIRSANNHGWSDYSEIMPFEGVYVKHDHHNKHKNRGQKDVKERQNNGNTLTAQKNNVVSNSVDNMAAEHQQNELSKDASVKASESASTAAAATQTSFTTFLISLMSVITTTTIYLNVARQ